jgi:RNA polymerase sigma-70 factor (ECF subfamily)
MTDTETTTDDLLRRARAGDTAALGALFGHYRDRLRKMVRLRLDRRVGGRLDPSDVLQEAYLDVARRFPEYAAAPAVPFYVWLRALTGQRLIDLHRRHLGAKMRDAGQEISLYRGALPQASSASLGQQLLAGFTSPTQAAVRISWAKSVSAERDESYRVRVPLDGFELLWRSARGLHAPPGAGYNLSRPGMAESNHAR